MKLLTVFLFFLSLACSENKGSHLFVSEDASSSPYPMNEIEESSAVIDDIENQKPKVEQKIIKTATLVFETKDITKSHKKILQLVKQNQGFLQTDNQDKGYNKVKRTLIIRVPTDNFNIMIKGVSEGVEFFDQKDISRKDVSEEFVDLTARLKAKKELEKRYLELLKKAKNVKEMLEIEKELSSIREEIEAKQGRLQYLQNKVSLSTIFIEFYKTTKVKGTSLSYGQKILNSLKGGWNGISVFFLGILYLWPLFLVAIIIFWLIKRYLKKRKK